MTIHDIVQHVAARLHDPSRRLPRILIVGDGGWDCYERLTTVRSAGPNDPVPVVRGDRQPDEHPAMATAVEWAVRATGAVSRVVDQTACGMHMLTRVSIDGREVYRRDTVQIAPKPEVIIQRMREQFRGDVDAVIIADYGRGAVTEEVAQEAIRLAMATEIPVIVDPHRNWDWSKYRGATAIKASGAFHPQGDSRFSEHHIRITTLGYQGVQINNHRIPARPPHWRIPGGEVDPIGAGDVFSAWLAVGLACRLPWQHAVAIGAAGMSVERFGTATPPKLAEVAADASEWESCFGVEHLVPAGPAASLAREAVMA
jgi:bifunctional ADP-heptose synthase (sugar kinase/adenylyltransferase)